METRKTKTLKTSEEWYIELYPNNEIEIIDPIGWDKLNFSDSYFNERITKDEFNIRVLLSEVNYGSTKR